MAKQALLQGERDQARRLAHNLSGISANIGALILAEAAAAIEKVLAGEGEVTGHLSERLKQELQQVLRSISLYLDKET